MRHCVNETVAVYEHEGSNFADLMREVASESELLSWGEASWFNVHVASDMGEDGPIYRATLYVHS